MRRKDGPAIRDTLLWLGGLGVSGALAYHFWGSWLCVPFFALYGVLYGSATDSRWHECGHGTAFKTRWMNDVVYHIACFMIMREPTIWRWSHTRHHTDTIIVGRDPEIITPRPPDIVSLLLNIFAMKNTYTFFRHVFLHATGRLTADEATFVPEMERGKVYLVARIYLGCSPSSSPPASTSARSCRRCLSGCLPSTAAGWRSISASRSISAWPRTCSTIA